MTFWLSVWEGPLPASDDEAADVVYAMLDRMDEQGPEPPSERIQSFVADLLEKWPDLGEGGDEDSPWFDRPLIGSAYGTAIYFGMISSENDEENVSFVLEATARRGLVCFDHQLDRILPLRKSAADGSSA